MIPENLHGTLGSGTYKSTEEPPRPATRYFHNTYHKAVFAVTEDGDGGWVINHDGSKYAHGGPSKWAAGAFEGLMATPGFKELTPEEARQRLDAAF